MAIPRFSCNFLDFLRLSTVSNINADGGRMAQKITKDMTFYEILQMSPDVARVLSEFNLGCVGCLGATSESIAQGARAHGLDADDIVTALNEIFPD
jgi:hybrid cluster-associated redox disulfide protein